MDYKGYKLLDRILLVCRETATHADSFGCNGGRKGGDSYYQAYLVDPSNRKQAESARQWARWTEYGPSYRDADGKLTREYEIKHEPVVFEFDNAGFTLELLDCAGGSSQGGKLSFWNCIVRKADNAFKIGINSDMLLDLLKNAAFINGLCQSPLIFITQKGKVGMTVEGSETWKQCVKDKELKKELKTSAVSKFEFGDKVKTATINEVYLGTITKYYSFSPGRNDALFTYTNRAIDYSDCTITRLAKPITYHIFECETDWRGQDKKRSLLDIANNYNSSIYAAPAVKKKCPKRFIEGKIVMDCSEEEFKEITFNSIYNYNIYIDYETISEDRLLYYFLSKQSFGFGFEPFDLPENIMSLCTQAGVKYIDETV